MRQKREPQLIFCYAVLNAADTLKTSLESIKPYADRIVLVEGRFKGRDGPPHSTDDTIAIAQEYEAEIVNCQDLPQDKQRDKYLDGKPDDFYFILDGDEALEGDFQKSEVLSARFNCYALWIRNQPGTYPSATMTLRLYRHIGTRPHHNPGQLLIDGHGKLMDGSYPEATHIDTFWLRHLKHGA